jgi:peptide deformylase
MSSAEHMVTHSRPLPLLYYPDPRLQMVCDPLPMETIEQWQQAGQLLDQMWETVDKYNGWGLAAPQIGSPCRAIVVHVNNNGKIGCSIEIINPLLVPLPKHGTFSSDEGCLSWPGNRVRVKRWRKVKVKGFDRYGVEITYGGKNQQAAALQHEIEHLDGINLADY